MIKQREPHIGLLRILACMMVIFNHTNERGFFRYASDDIGSIEWAVNLIPSIVCKSAVPIFFMISGTLLLRKTESMKQTFLRIPRILLDLVLFSILYYAVDSYLQGTVFVISGGVTYILRKIPLIKILF